MKRKKHLRRTAIICCHFIQNLAFYKAGFNNTHPIFAGQFWTRANGNFLDICVLEWCKLFGDAHGKHYWGKLVTDNQAFLVGLLTATNLTEPEFEVYTHEMRAYRDKFIAHLDSNPVMQIPRLDDTGRRSVLFLYDHLLTMGNEGDIFCGAPHSLSNFYDHFFIEGKNAYKQGAKSI